MPYHLLPIIESDLAHLAALATHAFNYESEYEITMALQSHRPTPDSLARTEAEYRKMLRQAADPALCLKVVDDGVPTQKALGCIFAMQYEQSPTALSEDLGNVVWKTEDDREYATLIKRERNMVVLNAFAQVSGPVTRMPLVFFAFGGALLMEFRGCGLRGGPGISWARLRRALDEKYHRLVRAEGPWYCSSGTTGRRAYV